MLLAKKDKDEQVLLAKDQAWMESSSDSDQEINANMVFIAQIEKVLFDSEASSSSIDEKISEVIGLGYTPMFLTHSDEALEIEKFKRSRKNKIEFTYNYGNLNASYVNEKINFKDDYFQDIINSDFEKIDSPFQQTSLLKPYVPNIILIYLLIIDSGCSKHMTDDYSRYTWVFFLHSKDEASEVIISFIKKTQVNLQLQVQRVRTDNGTEFKNKTLAKLFDESILNNMIPNVDEASTSHNVFNERLEDAYFDASTSFHDPSNVHTYYQPYPNEKNTSFHDPSNVHTYYQPYPNEKKWTKDHPLYKIIGDPKSNVRRR
nr:retrovirus-related Pol polyprotein from transposon TNT 1-94 [Tanacetum cinerariifolium]